MVYRIDGLYGLKGPDNIVDSKTILRMDQGFYIAIVLWAPLRPLYRIMSFWLTGSIDCSSYEASWAAW